MNKKYFFESCVGNPPYTYIPTVRKARGNISLAIWPHILFSISPASNESYLITPAKFLFGILSGKPQTLTRLQNDAHIRVINTIEENPFMSADIPDGLCILSYNNNQQFSPVGVSLVNPELASFVSQVQNKRLTPITQNYHLADIFNTESINKDFANIKYIRSRSIPSSMMRNYRGSLFTQIKNLSDDVKMLGVLSARKREFLYIKRKYLIDRGCLDFYKVAVPRISEKKNTSDTSQVIIGDTQVLYPGESFSESFGVFGPFLTKEEAVACQKYTKTQFFRALVYLAKPTPHCYIQQFRLVPLLNFTSASFIDWNRSITQIDEQLFQWFKITEKDILLIKTLISKLS